MQSSSTVILDSWIHSIQKWAAAEPLVKTAYLFGSRVKGCVTAESDLDVAIEIDEDDEGQNLAAWIFEADRWRTELNDRVPVQVDLQCMTENDTVVAPAVRDHGRLIYSHIQPEK